MDDAGMPEHAHMLRIQPCTHVNKPLCVLLKLTKARDGGGSSEIVKGFSTGTSRADRDGAVDSAHVQRSISQATWTESGVKYTDRRIHQTRLISRKPERNVYRVT